MDFYYVYSHSYWFIFHDDFGWTEHTHLPQNAPKCSAYVYHFDATQYKSYLPR